MIVVILKILNAFETRVDWTDLEEGFGIISNTDHILIP